MSPDQVPPKSLEVLTDDPEPEVAQVLEEAKADGLERELSHREERRRAAAAESPKRS